MPPAGKWFFKLLTQIGQWHFSSVEKQKKIHLLLVSNK